MQILYHVERKRVNLWIEVPLTKGWTAAYRIAITAKGAPVLAELRAFPSEQRKSRAPGTWSAERRGIAATVPKGGLRAGAMKALRPARVLQQLDAALATAVEQHPDLMAAWPKWRGTRLGQRPERKPRQRRGRKPHSDVFLATVAKQYSDALGTRSPVQHVAELHDEDVVKVRGWIHQARLRKFLDGPSEQGRARGSLSAKAVLTLEMAKSKTKSK
jgi:hypothetical protein